MPRISKNPSVGALTELERLNSKRLQALANPVRLAIVQYIAIAGEATATECAASAGVSPTACSYHLRKLAECGIVSASASHDGRERPWRLDIGATLTFEAAASGSALESDQHKLELAMEERDRAAVTQFLNTSADQGDDWRKAATLIQDLIKLDSAELEAFGIALHSLLRDFSKRAEQSNSKDQRWIYVSLRAVPWVGGPVEQEKEE